MTKEDQYKKLSIAVGMMICLRDQLEELCESGEMKSLIRQSLRNRLNALTKDLTDQSNLVLSNIPTSTHQSAQDINEVLCDIIDQLTSQ